LPLACPHGSIACWKEIGGGAESGVLGQWFGRKARMGLAWRVPAATGPSFGPAFIFIPLRPRKLIENAMAAPSTLKTENSRDRFWFGPELKKHIGPSAVGASAQTRADKQCDHATSLGRTIAGYWFRGAPAYLDPPTARPHSLKRPPTVHYCPYATDDPGKRTWRDSKGPGPPKLVGLPWPRFARPAGPISGRDAVQRTWTVAGAWE